MRIKSRHAQDMVMSSELPGEKTRKRDMLSPLLTEKNHKRQRRSLKQKPFILVFVLFCFKPGIDDFKNK